MISRKLLWSPDITERNKNLENVFVTTGVHHTRILFHTFSCNFDQAEEYRKLYGEKMLVSKETAGLHWRQETETLSYLKT